MTEKKMRILAAGDIHGDASLTKKLAEKAEKEKADVVILCGDITSLIETKNLLKPFKEKNQRVPRVRERGLSGIKGDVYRGEWQTRIKFTQ